VALETVYRRGHQRPAQDDARIVDEVARREAIGTIEHQVVLRKERAHVRCAQLERMGNDAHFRVQRREPLASGLGFQLSETLAVEQHLALEVGEIDAVAIEQPERAAAGRREVKRRR